MILAQGGDICDTRIQVTEPYGVSYSLVLFLDRFVVLAIRIGRAPIGETSRFLTKILRFFQVFGITGHPVHFNKPHLDNGMPRGLMDLS